MKAVKLTITSEMDLTDRHRCAHAERSSVTDRVLDYMELITPFLYLFPYLHTFTHVVG